MYKQTFVLLKKILGVILIIIGIIGLFLPIIQGALLIIAGLLLFGVKRKTIEKQITKYKQKISNLWRAKKR